MEPLKHECGIAMVRLRKPLSYYHDKYGTWMYGLNKLYLLMEKQHNRGQEGAGLAVVKLNSRPGEEYLFRERALGANAISEIFDSVHKDFQAYSREELGDAEFAASQIPYAGECYMGHLRYSTTGKSGLTFVHPMIRRSNWRAKCLSICGNFNLTNVDGIFDEITSVGQHPRNMSDTHILLEQIGHRLDREVERLFRIGKEQNLKGMDITHFIEERIDLSNVLKKCSPFWDGGYVMCGLTGSGESYAVRDPWGIRPAFYYIDDEIVVTASERPVIQTVMNLSAEAVRELMPGEAIFVNSKGEPRIERILEPKNYQACSFERIYFSRGSDQDIYRERKALGYLLSERILRAIDYDISHTVFSFIPNTAEVAYYGMLEGIDHYLDECKIREIRENPNMSEAKLREILGRKVRSEKVAIKDIKLRTFITEGNSRNDLAAHVYDITYGTVQAGVDNLVVIDDSIVRGTTLRQSIIGIMDRLQPKKIVIVSSSPQIRYPDYYGIDMRKMREFVAFRSAVALLQERGMEQVLHDAYAKTLELRKLSSGQEVENVVKTIYKPFTAEEISAKMVELLKPEGVRAKVEIVYQSLEGLHQAIPNHPGDWYFSGDYPTPGGAHLVNEAFISYMEEDYGK
ncbi:amidophosphoribosyltransferase [Porphyromonas gingivalis]|uniref:glutamine amidotransferase n=1 Tax=Porphyromonas gingivalis TaxID=837 RepID=UPI00036182A4|nr:glutamine amidotransferase [Porphyromonas gingivalis]EOA10073.1 class II glutamine amidotransferase domain protein [Porphyromonas gingivalis JCVI SC001]ATS01709.1 amidophosphoribosyltransferase [Porphyromonas gingivalis]ETA26273.1 amidophosphoribosyltransferase [Porphyromonas gingivalis SJD2]MCE8164916.1 amidophosphoribosyltransferase [Porphyromonas gingivalis]MDH7902972.1 amidophosphoribosyltransferase [Porphyromonas gingivalis]